MSFVVVNMASVDYEADLELLRWEVAELERRAAAARARLDVLGDVEEEPADAVPALQDLSDVPPEATAKVQHTPFDLSIAHMFSQVTQEVTPRVPVRLLAAENAYRLGGVTFFPVDETAVREYAGTAAAPADTEAVAAAASTEPGALLNAPLVGIRFDTYAATQRRFLPPHYTILKRETEKTGSTWRVFKHTLPQYIPQGPCEDPVVFAREIHRALRTVQTRRDWFEGARGAPGVTRVDSDLSCEYVKMVVGGREVSVRVGARGIEQVEGDVRLQQAMLGLLSRDPIKVLEAAAEAAAGATPPPV